ncbi:MAG: hypothetical protein GY696_37190 [Gammaproteobacteria bacterium]|nr:hypothetical protein [Gammaproteobacteria bacterium]
MKVAIVRSDNSYAVPFYSKSCWNMLVTNNKQLLVHINAVRVAIIEASSAQS